MVNKVDRYSQIKNSEFSKYLGEAKGMEKCDVHFFRVTARQALCLDPSIGKLMEQSYCAFFDAGKLKALQRNFTKC